MKKEFLIYLICITVFKTADAQVLKSNTLVSANKITYNVVGNEKIEGATLEFNTVFNKNNQYRGKTPKVVIDPALLVEKTAKGSFLAAFTQSFSNARLKELTKERVIVLTLCFTPDGKVVEIEYLLQKNSSLTAIELETLENALKKNVIYKLDSSLTKRGDFFRQSVVIRYQAILNGNEP